MSRSLPLIAPRKPLLRFASGAGAILLGDLIFGLGAFCTITLGSLWVFSIGWIRLSQEMAAAGLPFGSAWQLELAWVGVVTCLPMLGATVFLAVRALQLPRSWFRYFRTGAM